MMTAISTLSDGGRAPAAAFADTGRPQDVFTSLASACSGRGLDAMAGRLGELRAWIDSDLGEIERAIGAVGGGDTLAVKSARHLLDRTGKRLRPLCVALAARVGDGFNPTARRLAVAVELVHNATLLHDDVVDLGERRRGSDAARVIYGNAASIFGGDWLLAEALCHIQAAGLPEVMGRMLEVIKEMVLAESIQLAQRGQVRSSVGDYFRIISGKTASLFRWAMFAGARAGNASEEAERALEVFGENLGIGFQLVDDVLDFAGDPEATGKSLLSDLREGKMTYPLLLAVERDPELRAALEEFCAEGDAAPTPEVGAHVAAAMEATGAVDESLTLATRFCEDAVKSLAPLPEGLARAALEGVAIETPRRRR